MTECVNPALIKEGDLLAYVEGEANAEVRGHVERCPACAGQVAQLRYTSQALLSLVYRADCPAPEVLGQYQLDLLSSDEQVLVAAHLRACSHCTRELNELVTAEDSLSQMILQVIQRAVRVVEGTLVPTSRPHPAGVRGWETRQRAYHGAGLDVLVGFQPSVPGGAKGAVVGAILQAEAVAGGQVWLFQEGTEPLSNSVDEMGSFAFEGVAPGTYNLALEVGEEALLLREVVVG